MNERIRELAEQAGFNPYNYEGANAALFKKFAELILEDMHRKVIASILITDVVMNEKGQTPTSEDYLLAIHKDFGVEANKTITALLAEQPVQLLSLRSELASREAEIALLKTALMAAEAAPQQEVQEHLSDEQKQRIFRS